MSRQELLATPFPVNRGAQPCGFEMGLDRVGTIDRVGPDLASGLGGQQRLFQVLTFMHGRIGHRILPNELVLLSHVHRVLVARLILAMLHRPTSFRVFLLPVRGLTLPRRRTLAGFDRRACCVAWARKPARHQSVGRHGVVSRARPDRFQIVQEGLHDLSLGQRFPKEPDRFGIGEAVMKIQPQEPHERQAVSDLILGLSSDKLLKA